MEFRVWDSGFGVRGVGFRYIMVFSYDIMYSYHHNVYCVLYMTIMSYKIVLLYVFI